MSRRGTTPSAYPVQRIRSGPRWFGYAHHWSWSARERVARYCCPVSCAVLCSLPNACPCSWTSRESSTMGASGATERKYRRSTGGHSVRERGSASRSEKSPPFATQRMGHPKNQTLGSGPPVRHCFCRSVRGRYGASSAQAPPGFAGTNPAPPPGPPRDCFGGRRKRRQPALTRMRASLRERCLGRMTISMSRSSAVRKCISRSTENPSSR